MDREQFADAIIQYGTPLYVFHIDELKKRLQDIRNKIPEAVKLCYAMKANPFLVLQMEKLTERIEVCSMGEYRICKAQGVKTENLLISGVLKKRENLYEILNNCGGRCCYTIESLNQFYDIAKWSNSHNIEILVYIRLTSGNQFGMDYATIENLLSMRDVFPKVKILGIHYFSGTQKKNVVTVINEIKKLDDFCLSLEKKTGCRMKELEYGPGIMAPYFEGQGDMLSEMLFAISHAIEHMKWKGTVTLEMGRALVAACGYYLTSIRDLKTNDAVNYCIVDGGIHQVNYDGQIRGLYTPKFMVSPQNETGPEQNWTICGSLCTANDVLAKEVTFIKPRIGQVLIFQNAGAYAMTEGMALFLSHALPKVVLFEEKTGWKLVRNEQETYKWNTERITEDGNLNEYFNRD